MGVGLGGTGRGGSLSSSSVHRVDMTDVCISSDQTRPRRTLYMVSAIRVGATCTPPDDMVYTGWLAARCCGYFIVGSAGRPLCSLLLV